MNRVVEFFDESDRFEVFIVAVLIRKPLARFFIVIEIKHGRDRVNSYAVDMILFKKEARRRNEKRLNFRSAVIEPSRSPLFMLYSVPTLIFIERRAVEFVKTEFVFRKMRRNPIENNADIIFVKRVDESHKILRRSEP